MHAAGEGRRDRCDLMVATGPQPLHSSPASDSAPRNCLTPPPGSSCLNSFWAEQTPRPQLLSEHSLDSALESPTSPFALNLLPSVPGLAHTACPRVGSCVRLHLSHSWRPGYEVTPSGSVPASLSPSSFSVTGDGSLGPRRDDSATWFVFSGCRLPPWSSQTSPTPRACIRDQGALLHPLPRTTCRFQDASLLSISECFPKRLPHCVTISRGIILIPLKV